MQKTLVVEKLWKESYESFYILVIVNLISTDKIHLVFTNTQFYFLTLIEDCTFFYNVDPPTVKSLFWSPSMIFSTTTVSILHKYCQMAPLYKIYASNDASTSFSFFPHLLFFSDCYCSNLRNELDCSLFLLLWLRWIDFCWFELKKIFGGGKIWTLNLPI